MGFCPSVLCRGKILGVTPKNSMVLQDQLEFYQPIIFGFYRFFYTFSAAPSNDSWQDLELPMHTWIVVVSGVVLFWFFLSCFLAFCCGPKFVECHLCEQPIPKKQWNKREHWDSCAKDHERFLNELPDTDYRCPSWVHTKQG